jgi:hypothetical protein
MHPSRKASIPRKIGQRRVLLQQHVVFPGQRNEPRAGYSRSEFTAQFDRDPRIVTDVHDERRRALRDGWRQRLRRQSPGPKPALRKQHANVGACGSSGRSSWTAGGRTAGHERELCCSERLIRQQLALPRNLPDRFRTVRLASGFCTPPTLTSASRECSEFDPMPKPANPRSWSGPRRRPSK